MHFGDCGQDLLRRMSFVLCILLPLSCRQWNEPNREYPSIALPRPSHAAHPRGPSIIQYFVGLQSITSRQQGQSFSSTDTESHMGNSDQGTHEGFLIWQKKHMSLGEWVLLPAGSIALQSNVAYLSLWPIQTLGRQDLTFSVGALLEL